MFLFENIATPRREHEPADGILRDCILGLWRDGVSDETKAEAIDALQALPESIPQMCVRACGCLGVCAREGGSQPQTWYVCVTMG